MRRFEVSFRGSVTVEVDDAVISAVDDEWRSKLYDLNTPEEIAAHIAYNMVFNRLPLSRLDGWADQPDSNASIGSGPEVDMEDVEEIL